MKCLIVALVFVLGAGAAAQNTTPVRSTRSQASIAVSDSQFWEQRWEQMIQQQKDEAASLNTEAAQLQALLLQLQTNSGTMQNTSLRTSLQVNAELWESLIAHIRTREQQLQQQIQTNEATLKIWRSRH